MRTVIDKLAQIDEALAAYDARPQGSDDESEILMRAWAIAKTGKNISYPSGVASEQVRETVRGLLAIVEKRNVTRPQASGDLVERLRHNVKEIGSTSSHMKGIGDWQVLAKTLNEAADALSRAPQPFTAEEWKELAERHSGHGYVTLTCKERN